MRLFRRLTALLLIATLPAYAWAALGVPQACPMQAAAAARGEAPCCDTAGAADEDADHRTGGYHPCKPGQECKTGSLYQPAFPHLERIPTPGADIVVAPAAPVFSRDLSRIWRPPRFL